MRAWLAVAILLCIVAPTSAHDDGRYANSELKQWFDGLKSDLGLYCSFADGITVEDPDVTMDHGSYQVRVWGQWVDVPDAAVIKEPNKFGAPVVWPFKDMGGVVHVRCFMPGSGA